MADQQLNQASPRVSASLCKMVKAMSRTTFIVRINILEVVIIRNIFKSR